MRVIGEAFLTAKIVLVELGVQVNDAIEPTHEIDVNNFGGFELRDVAEGDVEAFEVCQAGF